MLNTSLLRKFTTIRLTDQESKVFSALLEASDAMGRGTILRAAGGWVRDKLMGNESSDIDIALDNTPGDGFAFFVRDHESTKGHCSSVGVVKENPDQSKHIRTASFRLHGLDLDINNLRSESYADNSRIPEVKFAQHPSEDAFRRDFTINALYYNLNTKEVEDYTGSGLSDLDQGIIRTPLPASKTFVDDPLRVLRAIRFSARFGFKLDHDIEDAWSREDVRDGLMNKVSRERIGVEITKMMKDKNALSAIRTLSSSGLLDLIFRPPTDASAPSLAGISPKDYQSWCTSWEGWRDQDMNEILDRAFTLQNHHDPNDPTTYFFALLMSNIASNNISLISRLAMKIPNELCKNISTILSCRDEIGRMMSSSDDAVVWGRLIRTQLKSLWPEAIMISLAVSSKPQNELIEQFEKISKFIMNNKLDDCWNWKPVMDGTEIQKSFNLPASKKIQELLNYEFDLMFSGIVDRDEIAKKLAQKIENI